MWSMNQQHLAESLERQNLRPHEGESASEPEPQEIHMQITACYYDGETKEPPFATFFEDQAEVKRAHARQFLKYLRKHESKICLPVIQRPDIDNWGTGLQALESALELENTLNNLLQDLKTLASENHETDLSRFLGKFLDKQKRNIRYLENQVGYQKELEKLAQKENPSEKTPEASAKEA
ncbi:soma ferritin-like [Equus asinus]|uniref:soma ferritin-like n=1 Tax=Equus asinus TaxID=9793 RepID=UPI00071A2DBE